MTIRNGFQVIPALATAVLLIGCGGGGGGASGLVTSDVVSSGVITQFGSVYVNGVRYATEGARILSADDGSLIVANPSDDQLRRYLGLGQVVTVQGSSSSNGSNGVAFSVAVDSELVGPVATGSVSNTNATFVVLGQTLSVTPDTIIDDSMIERVLGADRLTEDVRFADIETVTGQVIRLGQLLLDGMVVEVSGFPLDNGFEVTRIEDVNDRDRNGIVPPAGISGGTEAEVKGSVRNLAGGQFELHGLTVFFDASDLDFEDFGSGGLAEGDYVEVKGSVQSANTIDATRIEREDDFTSSSTTGRVEFEGVVTEVRPDSTGSGGVIVFNGLEVRVSNISAFTVDSRIEMKGVLENGVLQVSSVEDENEDSVRIEDLATTITSGQVITRLGVTVDIDSRTRIEDSGAGDWIEARAFPLNGSLQWTRVKFDDDNDSDCRLQGPVESITGTNANDFGFVIEGVTIDVNQISSFGNFQNASGIGIGREAFYDQLDVGDVVKAKSTSGGCVFLSLTAREVEFEDGNTLFGGAGTNNQLTGAVSNVTSTSFVVGGETVSVNGATLIDDSIVEAARGVELSGDRRFDSLPESLSELLPQGLNVSVVVSRSGGLVIATLIEDL